LHLYNASCCIQIGVMDELLTMLVHKGKGSQVMKLYLRAYRRLTGGTHAKDEGCVMQVLVDINELQSADADNLTKELWYTVDRVYAGDTAATIRAKVQAMTGTALASVQSPLGAMHTHTHARNLVHSHAHTRARTHHLPMWILYAFLLPHHTAPLCPRDVVRTTSRCPGDVG
jgi:hypothetical protein